MEGLIDGLLSYSRASRADMSREKLDLTTLVELVYFELRHAQPDRVVECHVDPGINAWGDVRLVMTVLRSVFGNAWKFSARNVTATIRCHVEERDGRSWICVTDDGAGFDMTQAARLFKPFTRLHRQDEFPGQGMGLATAHRIVNRHGGEIEADSRRRAGDRGALLGLRARGIMCERAHAAAVIPRPGARYGGAARGRIWFV